MAGPWISILMSGNVAFVPRWHPDCSVSHHGVPAGYA